MFGFIKRFLKAILELILISIFLVIAGFITWKGFYKNREAPLQHSPVSIIKITSPAFEEGKTIPKKYSCDGEDINPPLHIDDVSDRAQSLAIILDDPDASAGVWNHWLVWNIDPMTREIKEGKLPKGALLGINDFEKLEYEGPCPTSGNHRYYFRVYALDTKLTLKQGLNRQSLDTAMEGHTIEKASLMGTFSR